MKWGVDPAADSLKADEEAQDTAAVGGDVDTICEETPIQGPSLGGSKEELQDAREDVKTERPIVSTNLSGTSYQGWSEEITRVIALSRA